MSKHIELAKKLKVLSKRGIGGEKENAERMLSEIMTKYGLSDEDIEGEKLNEYYFNIEKSDNKFWCQVVRHVNRTIQILKKSYQNTRKAIL
jgi:DNA polymerase III delta prime subunit